RNRRRRRYAGVGQRSAGLLAGRRCLQGAARHRRAGCGCDGVPCGPRVAGVRPVPVRVPAPTLCGARRRGAAARLDGRGRRRCASCARGAHAMTKPRVPRLGVEEAKAAADEAGVPNYMAELAIFQVLLNHPTLARRVNDLLAMMLWHGTLDTRLRELAIMRIGWLTASDYEWTQHWRVALGLGVSADDLV